MKDDDPYAINGFTKNKQEPPPLQESNSVVDGRVLKMEQIEEKKISSAQGAAKQEPVH